MKRIPWIVPRLIPVAALIFGVACNDSSTDGAKTKSVQAADSHPAANDVQVKSCSNDPTLDTGQPVVTVTNHTSKASTYAITVRVDSADGKTQIETTYATVDHLAPGQTTDANALMSKQIPNGAVCKVAEVDRVAS
jgi:hypothetical protein